MSYTRTFNSACLWFLIMSPDPYVFFILVRNILMVLGRIIEKSMRNVVCKNDNSANLCYLIMSPDPYFSQMGFRSITPKPFEIFE